MRVYGNTRHTRNAERSPNIRFAILLILPFVDRMDELREHNGETRERIPSERCYRRQRTYLEGVQIYTKCPTPIQPFFRTVHSLLGAAPELHLPRFSTPI